MPKNKKHASKPSEHMHEARSHSQAGMQSLSDVANAFIKYPIKGTYCFKPTKQRQLNKPALGGQNGMCHFSKCCKISTIPKRWQSLYYKSIIKSISCFKLHLSLSIVTLLLTLNFSKRRAVVESILCHISYKKPIKGREHHHQRSNALKISKCFTVSCVNVCNQIR